MALAVAIPLFGLECGLECGLGLDCLRSLTASLLAEEGPKSSTNSGLSTPTSGSVSSEVNNLKTSNELDPKIESTLISSKLETAKALGGTQEKTIRVMHEGRDILNIGANLREPLWQMRHPMSSRYDFNWCNQITTNQSGADNYNGFEHNEDYSEKYCKYCEFDPRTSNSFYDHNKTINNSKVVDE